MDMNNEIIAKLKALTGKSRIILTRRGNKALKFTLKALQAAGFTKVIIQDQGGWITYPQYAEELGLGLVSIKTDYGMIDKAELKATSGKNSIILINSMPGYFAYEDMKSVSKIAKETGAVLVNDASGSIGTENAKLGDIIFGSFGRWKPVNAGYGGFIATNEDYFGDMPSVFSENYSGILMQKLDGLKERTACLRQISRKVKNDLKGFKIIHPEADGFNVVVKFSTEEEKEKILNYCSENELEHTLCPRYIRVNDDAVCIEVKRK